MKVKILRKLKKQAGKSQIIENFLQSVNSGRKYLKSMGVHIVNTELALIVRSTRVAASQHVSCIM